MNVFIAGATACAPPNLAEDFFRHVRRYLSRFPGRIDAAHSEQVLGGFLLAAERMHASNPSLGAPHPFDRNAGQCLAPPPLTYSSPFAYTEPHS